MKKLILNANPFILLLLPVVIAMLIGLGYQAREKTVEHLDAGVQATSLFYKGITLVKTVCGIAKQELW